MDIASTDSYMLQLEKYHTRPRIHVEYGAQYRLQGSNCLHTH